MKSWDAHHQPSDNAPDFVSFQVGHSFRDAKGQGRRNSSKILKDLNEKGSRSQEAAVAALSEENRGAVALAAFKLGLKEKTSSATPKMIKKVSDRISRRYMCESATKTQARENENMITVETNCRLITATDVCKNNCSETVSVRMCADVIACTPVVPKDEFETAVASLLFLQRAVRVSPVESESENGSLADRNSASLPPFRTTRNAANPFRQICAASLPNESNGTNALYFI